MSTATSKTVALPTDTTVDQILTAPKSFARFARKGASLGESGKSALLALARKGHDMEATGAAVVAVAAWIATESGTITGADFARELGVSGGRVSQYRAFGHVLTTTDVPAGVTPVQILTAAGRKSGELNKAAELSKVAERKAAVAEIIARDIAEQAKASKRGPVVPDGGNVEGEKDGTETPDGASGDETPETVTPMVRHMTALVEAVAYLTDTIGEQSQEDRQTILSAMRVYSDAYAALRSNSAVPAK